MISNYGIKKDLINGNMKMYFYFNKLENDLDFSDDFHGSDGPILAQRFPESEWTEPQKLFYEACIKRGTLLQKI